MSNNTTQALMEAYGAVYYPELREEYSEIEELGLMMIENAAYLLFSQGYDAYDLISYLADAKEETITEDYINFSEGRILLENVAVSDEYIDQQFENLSNICEYLISENLLARAARPAMSLIGRVASKPARMKAATRLAQSANPARTAGAYQRLARQNLNKAGFSSGKTATFKNTADAVRTSVMAKPVGFLNKAASNVKGAFNATKGALSRIPGAGAAARLVKSPVGKVGGKLGGKVLPGVGFMYGTYDAYNRAKKGDWGGAALSGLNAATSTFLPPGAGTAASLGVMGLQAATDAAGLTGDKSKKGSPAKTAPSPSGNNAKWNASAARGGQTALRAGGGQAAIKAGKSAADVQAAGMRAIRAREKLPNTAAGFDQAFASARGNKEKTFKWQGKEYTTQVAHFDMFDLIGGYLLDEGYADTEESAIVIMANMSEEWIEEITEILKEEEDASYDVALRRSGLPRDLRQAASWALQFEKERNAREKTRKRRNRKTSYFTDVLRSMNKD